MRLRQNAHDGNDDHTLIRNPGLRGFLLPPKTGSRSAPRADARGIWPPHQIALFALTESVNKDAMILPLLALMLKGSLVVPSAAQSPRDWTDLIPVGLHGSASVAEDPYRASSSPQILEADYIHSLSSPAILPQFLSKPTAEPSKQLTTPRPTIYRDNRVGEESWGGRPPSSYFDYDPRPTADRGPGHLVEDKEGKIAYRNNGWSSVRRPSERSYWFPLQDSIKESLSDNVCKGSDLQSPINITPTPGAECLEHHQIRTRPGDFDYKVSDWGHIFTEIHPNKLRMRFPRRQGDEPDPPFADFPNGWGGNVSVSGTLLFAAIVLHLLVCFVFVTGLILTNFSFSLQQMDALHADLKIPSEHTLEGKQYAAEYQLYHLHLERKRAPVISVMIDVADQDDGNDRGHNAHLQLALDAFQSTFNEDQTLCNEHEDKLERFFLRRRRVGEIGPVMTDDTTASQPAADTYAHRIAARIGRTSNVSRGKWDPYHADLLPSIYFYGYSGSLTEPPCSEFIEWRVLDTPMVISSAQLLQMQTLLFNHVDEQCQLTSNHYRGSVARPLQDLNDRAVYRCTCRDFVDDQARGEEERRKCSEKHFQLAKGAL